MRIEGQLKLQELSQLERLLQQRRVCLRVMKQKLTPGLSDIVGESWKNNLYYVFIVLL